MILDLLLEKKDILAYINARTKDLLIQQTRIESLPEHKRETTRKKFIGRIKELEHLRIVIESGRLKDQSKHHWKNIHNDEGNKNGNNVN
jgi:hypothetical protein